VIVGHVPNLASPEMQWVLGALRNGNSTKKQLLQSLSQFSGGIACGVQSIESLYLVDSPYQDWAIITLDTRVPVRPVKVAGLGTATMPADVLRTSRLRGLGYGQTNVNTDSAALYLQEIPVNITSMDGTCLYGTGTGKGQSMCYGDSGGPLLVIGASPAEDLVIGITAREGLNPRGECTTVAFYRTDALARSRSKKFKNIH
jgi:secreted trypsin-like serine protease